MYSRGFVSAEHGSLPLCVQSSRVKLKQNYTACYVSPLGSLCYNSLARFQMISHQISVGDPAFISKRL